MSSIAKRKVKGITYYYLEESVKRGKRWKKESKYLGNEMPDEEQLKIIYYDFSENLKKKGIEGLTPPFTEFITRNWALRIGRATCAKEEFLKQLSPGKRAEFVRRERITFISDSNAIEGSTLDFQQTDDVLSTEKRLKDSEKKGLVVTGFGKEEQEAINLNKCLDLYEKFLSRRIDISEGMILQLHLFLLSKIEGYETYKGTWRPVNVMVRGSPHVFPHFAEVPGLVHELLLWHKKNEGLIHPVELAAKFHTKFTSIHPFADGNGRMARLLMNYILQLNGLPFTNIPLRRRSEYMRTQAAGNKSDHKPFAIFLAEEIVKQNKKLKR